jgi:hypothetical protein
VRQGQLQRAKQNGQLSHPSRRVGVSERQISVENSANVNERSRIAEVQTAPLQTFNLKVGFAES